MAAPGLDAEYRSLSPEDERCKALSAWARGAVDMDSILDRLLTTSEAHNGGPQSGRGCKYNNQWEELNLWVTQEEDRQYYIVITDSSNHSTVHPRLNFNLT